MDTPRSSADGFTLVEVLMAMIVLGIGIAALLTAMGMHAKTSFVNRNQAQAESLLTAASEYVKSTAYPATCTAIPNTPIPATGAPLPHDPAFTISYGPGAQFDGASFCAIQQVPVTVSGQGFSLTVWVVKRPMLESS